MKIHNFLIILVVCVLFIACDEIGPNIVLEETITLTDSTFIATTVPAAQDKTILLEEFSGVRCSNCPDGHELAETLFDNIGERFISVTINTREILGNPYSGQINLNTQVGSDIQQSYGPVNTKPSGMVDRAGGNNRIIGLLQWQAAVQTALNGVTSVNINPSILAYNETTREIVLRTELIYTDVATGHFLGLFFVENEIISTQLNGSIVDEDYEHNHVLRDYITAIPGEQLNETLVAGRTFIRDFQFTLPEDWKKDNVELIAFVSTPSEVVHAAKLKLKQ